MRFQVLGPLEVTRERASIPLGGPKQRAVLAHLIVRANQVVPTDALIDQVWGEEPPESARNVLQTYISHLRSALGTEHIEGRTPGYILHLEPFELDAVRFESLVREARDANGQSDRAASLLKEALELWKGPAFADLGADESLVGEIARLNDLHLQALEERIGADIACGRHIDVIGEAEALIHEHPLRERLWGHLIIALYRSGPRVRRRPHRCDRQHDPEADERRPASAQRRILLLARPLDDRLRARAPGVDRRPRPERRGRATTARTLHRRPA